MGSPLGQIVLRRRISYIGRHQTYLAQGLNLSEVKKALKTIGDRQAPRYASINPCLTYPPASSILGTNQRSRNFSRV